MKRLIVACALLLCLVPVLILAESNYASGSLFPAEDENGKWGYVDHEGSFVILPRFDYAYGFRGNYAEVILYPKDYAGEHDLSLSGYCGIIDRDGGFVLDPVYTIDAGFDGDFYGGRDTGIWFITSGSADPDNPLEGWFDIESGYFSDLVWDDLWGWVYDSRLIPVVDETYRAGYADRTTGELVIPCQYQCVDPSLFYGGIASVSLEEEECDETGNRDCSSYFLIDETGKEIPLPEGVFAVPDEGAHDGLVLVSSHEDNDIFDYDDEALFGFADVQGNLIIKPQFIAARHFQDGLAVIQFPEGDWGRIDTSGFVMERGLDEEPWDNEYVNELGYDVE